MAQRTGCRAGCGGAAHAVRTCRTAALGGHVWRCPQGHVTEIWYNSCRHRACPRCCTQQMSQWLDGWQQQVLPTDQLHVIFTLPSELHELWKWNRHALTEVLFRCVRETLLTLFGRSEMVGRDAGDFSGVAYVGTDVSFASAPTLPDQWRWTD